MKIDTDGIFIRSDGKVICTLDSIVDYDGTRLPSKEGFEIARRICAAVNACEGIETEDLETRPASTGVLYRMSQNFVTLAKENARLRDILAKILECNKEASVGCVCDCVDNDGDYYQSALLSGALSLAERAIKPAEQSA